MIYNINQERVIKMSGTVHNWDISELKQLYSEIQKLTSVLRENKELLTSERAELLSSWQGKSAQKIFLETAASTESLDSLINCFTELGEELNNVITKCYEPCESNIRSRAANLI